MRIKLLLKVLFCLLIAVNAGLIVTMMPAPLPAIKGQAQCIWRAHDMTVVPQHLEKCFKETFLILCHGKTKHGNLAPSPSSATDYMSKNGQGTGLNFPNQKIPSN